MRFMFIVKSAHHGAPTPELLEAMNKLADREIKARRLLDMGGLTPLVTGAKVSHNERQTRRRRRPVCGGQRGHRRLRDFRIAGQRRGSGLGDGIHAAPQRSLAGLGRGMRTSSTWHLTRKPGKG
jgi:hypothetical protein